MAVEVVSARTRTYELFYGEDGHIELYDAENPSNGFEFNNEKELNLFINSVTDHLEKKYIERE